MRLCVVAGGLWVSGHEEAQPEIQYWVILSSVLCCGTGQGKKAQKEKDMQGYCIVCLPVWAFCHSPHTGAPLPARRQASLWIWLAGCHSALTKAPLTAGQLVNQAVEGDRHSRNHSACLFFFLLPLLTLILFFLLLPLSHSRTTKYIINLFFSSRFEIPTWHYCWSEQSLEQTVNRSDPVSV